MYSYSIEIRFDPESAEKKKKETYDKFLKDYQATAGSHEKESVFTLSINFYVLLIAGN